MANEPVPTMLKCSLSQRGQESAGKGQRMFLLSILYKQVTSKIAYKQSPSWLYIPGNWYPGSQLNSYSYSYTTRLPIMHNNKKNIYIYIHEQWKNWFIVIPRFLYRYLGSIVPYIYKTTKGPRVFSLLRRKKLNGVCENKKCLGIQCSHTHLSFGVSLVLESNGRQNPHTCSKMTFLGSCLSSNWSTASSVTLYNAWLFTSPVWNLLHRWALKGLHGDPRNIVSISWLEWCFMQEGVPWPNLDLQMSHASLPCTCNSMEL